MKDRLLALWECLDDVEQDALYELLVHRVECRGLLDRVAQVEAERDAAREALASMLAANLCDVCYEDDPPGDDCNCPCHRRIEQAEQTARATLASGASRDGGDE